jgi:hypothetical protein
LANFPVAYCGLKIITSQAPFLKDFFQSSMEDINLNELENIFIEEDKKGNSYIKVTFNPNSENIHKNQNLLPFSP